MLKDWILQKLEAVKDQPLLIVQDPLLLTKNMDNDLHAWGKEQQFTVIPCATNLLFREKYEQVRADASITKLLVLDQTPKSRRQAKSLRTAPSLFYPDLLARTKPEARIEIDLRQFLREQTGDAEWPQEANDPRYARLIVRHLDGVLRAHENLRAADKARFTDYDFKAIVAYAALGVPEAAFKKLDASQRWKIGLLGHAALQELESLAPEATRIVRDELRKAPAPFKWFADHDPEMVIRAFYLSLILSQHIENWSPLLANLDPALTRLAGIKDETLRKSAPELVKLDPTQAQRDIEDVEKTLSRQALQFLLVEQMQIAEPAHFTAAVEHENYSTLLRSLSLLLGLDNLLSTQPARDEQERLLKALFPQDAMGARSLVDTRQSQTWSDLKEAYRVAYNLQVMRAQLAKTIKDLGVIPTAQLTFDFFRRVWNDGRLNRLEYYLSSLERLLDTGEMLPRPADDLPPEFGAALARLRERVRTLNGEINRQIDDINRRFQEMVVTRYPAWVANDDEVILTSQFLRRCLKPHWDPQKEKAAVFIFDGMRYDIWHELLRPMLLDRMEEVKDYAASSLLPSETHITRKAISAGTYPDAFNTQHAENNLLATALTREFGLTTPVEKWEDGAGTGETVRYRAGNLDVYIFELCDKSLHHINVKKLDDGREVPARPLAFIYQQVLKNIIDTEVMKIMRGLAPGTKVFITADHGFGRIDREKVWLEAAWLNEPSDCSYRNARLVRRLADLRVPLKVQQSVWEMPVAALRMPAEETINTAQGPIHKEYASLLFPKVGYALSRPNSKFNPDAYTHGGISIQELMIPMVVLRVKSQTDGSLSPGIIHGPDEVIEGQDAMFRLPLHRASTGTAILPLDFSGQDMPATRRSRGEAETTELRVDVEASYSSDPERFPLPRQVVYVPAGGSEAVYQFRPDPADATPEERQQGVMERTLSISVSFYEHGRTLRRSATKRFAVKLNTEQVVRRVPPGLGNILGLTPKGMR